jgi:hypothetical protein
VCGNWSEMQRSPKPRGRVTGAIPTLRLSWVDTADAKAPTTFGRGFLVLTRVAATDAEKSRLIGRVPKILRPTCSVSRHRPTPGSLARCLTEQVPWDIEQDEAAAFLGMGLKIGLDKNLDGLVAGVNFDPDRGIAEIDFVPTTIVSPAEPRAAPMGLPAKPSEGFARLRPDDRVRHSVPAPLTRPVLLAGADRRNELGDHCSVDRAAQSTGIVATFQKLPREPQERISSLTLRTDHDLRRYFHICDNYAFAKNDNEGVASSC